MSDTPPAAAPNAEVQHPGALLGRAREALGIARADIAASLHLEEDLVAALEAGRDADLPAATYVRGYVRSYARLVGLDPEQLVPRLDSIAGAPYRTTRPVLRHSAVLPSFAERAQRHVGLLLGGIVLAVLLVAGGALWFVQGILEWPFADASSEPAAKAPAVVAAQPPPPPQDPTPSVAERAAMHLPAPADEAPPPPAPAPPTPAPLATGTTTSDPPATVPAAGALAFRFDDESWLEVRDAAGELIHANLGRAGETLALTGEPPFSILLGNAAGVELHYDGNPVALLAHTQQNVARLVVGR